MVTKPLFYPCTTNNLLLLFLQKSVLTTFTLYTKKFDKKQKAMEGAIYCLCYLYVTNYVWKSSCDVYNILITLITDSNPLSQPNLLTK